MGALISFFNISASIRWHCSCFKRTNTETVNRNSTTYPSNTSFQHPFFKQVLSLFLSAFLVILHVMLYSLGSSNYSFSVSIMGRSASWVFRKLHGNSFIVKCSINACVPPPPPPKKVFFRKYRKVVIFGSLRSLLLQSLLRELDALHTAGSLLPEVLEKL